MRELRLPREALAEKTEMSTAQPELDLTEEGGEPFYVALAVMCACVVDRAAGQVVFRGTVAVCLRDATRRVKAAKKKGKP